MSIPADTYCIQCVINRNIERARKLGTEQQATEFTKRLMKLMLEAPEGMPSPWYGPGNTDLLHELYGLDIDRFRQEKLDSNRFVLERLDRIRELVEGSADPVFAGLQFAIMGNYLDFSALHGQVRFEQLEQLLQEAFSMELDRDCYEGFCREMEAGKKLLYLTDNAGEIGFDRVLGEQLQKRYPHLEIIFCVRGAPAANDATREDAAAVGIPFPVIDNGNRVAGTIPELLGPEAKQALQTADVILAKGMGNAETLLGSGYPIYYAFLVKCPRFMNLFKKPMMTPMLIRETGAIPEY